MKNNTGYHKQVRIAVIKKLEAELHEAKERDKNYYDHLMQEAITPAQKQNAQMDYIFYAFDADERTAKRKIEIGTSVFEYTLEVIPLILRRFQNNVGNGKPPKEPGFYKRNLDDRALGFQKMVTDLKRQINGDYERYQTVLKKLKKKLLGDKSNNRQAGWFPHMEERDAIYFLEQQKHLFVKENKNALAA